jgi:O-antigen/teichoic acid export membrane protein
MSDNTQNSFQKVMSSSSLVFFGTLASLFIGLIARVIIIRSTTQTEYGLYSLALTITTVFVTFSTLGLVNGVPRHIAYLRGKSKIIDIKNVIYSTIIVACVASIVFMLVSLGTVELFSLRVFHESDLQIMLKIFSLSIPFFVITNILTAIFRGFDNTYTKVIFTDIMRPVLHLILVFIVVQLGLSFTGIIYSYVISIFITSIIISIFFIKNFPIKIKREDINSKPMFKEVLIFSLPLLIVNVLLTIMSWTDTLMLGYFKTPEMVAEYDAVYPIATLLSLVINSIAFLYVPIASQVYGREQIKELKTLDSSSTKWCFMLTLPMFFIIIIYPEYIINSLFGARYSQSSLTLQILAIGFILNSLFGLNYHTLLTIGKSNFLMNCSIISALLNIILNTLLIPSMGTLGAAIASALSFSAIEILMTIKLYSFLKIHPFTPSYVKTIVISIILICIFHIISNFYVTNIWTMILSLLAFLIVWISLIISTKSYDEMDLKTIKNAKNRMNYIKNRNILLMKSEVNKIKNNL